MRLFRNALRIILFLLIIGFAVYKTVDYFKPTEIKNGDDVLERVGKIVALPGDETPSILTVTDLEPLKDKPFFAEAKIGDKVLVFSKAGRVILYRPDTDKVIAVGPINK